MWPSPAIITIARGTHTRAAQFHDDAAEFWEQRGDPDRAVREHRQAEREREAAEIEQKRSKQPRSSRRKRPPAAPDAS